MVIDSISSFEWLIIIGFLVMILLILVTTIIDGIQFISFIRYLLGNNKSDWNEIPDNLVSGSSDDEFSENTETNDLENPLNIEKNNDAIGIVIGISVSLVSTFILAVVLLWVWSSISGEILGLNPPQALVTWEDEYRDLTGVNSLDGLDGTGVTLCIVDSGINVNHPDLSNMNLIGWNDVINSVDTPYDDDGHGTAMAGIIVADGGLNGVSKNVNLLVAKAIDSSGSGTDDGIAEAVDWCVNQDTDIISLSLGGQQGLGSSIITTDSLEIAVENAVDEGVYVIAAAGNDGENDDGDVSSPGSVEEVICVGGVTRLGNLWVGSSEGDNNGQLWPPKLPRGDPDKKPEIVAPGHEVPVLVQNQQSWWGWSSGTSASTAWVSGGLALFLQEHPEYQRNQDSDSSKVQEIKQLISQNSQMKEGQNQHDDHFGYGILRIDTLISSVNNSSSNNPVSEEYFDINYKKYNIFEIFQTERRITANVPPDNSTKAIE